MIELLAPAGNEKCFFAAINNGANAVYMGLGGFSARKNAGNFTAENIGYYVSYAKNLGVKVYVALNTLVKDSEFDSFLKEAEIALSVGADALIVQDLFLAPILKARFPESELHLSTQAGINNVEGAMLAQKYGFSRVILARETKKEEIARICEKIETEIFVHGALCSCFSGHCYMSSFIGGNSGNRGLCKQPCRKKYSLESKVGDGEYAISLADLNLSARIPELIKLGVKSFKIEGRMRTPEYVAAATRLYRAAIDGKKFDQREISRTFNRGDYTEGYVFGFNGDVVSDKIQNHRGEFFAKIKGVMGQFLQIGSTKTNEGDCFKIIRNGREVGNATTLSGGKITFKGQAQIGDNLNITKDVEINDFLNSIKKKKRVVNVYGFFKVGEKPVLKSGDVVVCGDEPLDEAKTRETTKEEIEENLSKTDLRPFIVESNVEVVGSPFIVKSKLNKLRNELYDKLFFSDVKHLKISDIAYDFKGFSKPRYNGIVLGDRPLKTPDDYAFVYRPKNYDDVKEVERAILNVWSDKYLFIPSFITEKEIQSLERLFPLFDGIYADGLAAIALARRYEKKLICGIGLNAYNSYDFDQMRKLGASDIVYSQELSESEIKQIKGIGYAFTFGIIRIAEFLYCPFGKKCASCERGDCFQMKDETGRTLSLHRYKIGGRCVFELYNEEILKCKKTPYNFYNFIGFSDDEIASFFNDEIQKIDKKFTNGNFKRGVL